MYVNPKLGKYPITEITRPIVKELLAILNLPTVAGQRFFLIFSRLAGIRSDEANQG